MNNETLYTILINSLIALVDDQDADKRRHFTAQHAAAALIRSQKKGTCSMEAIGDLIDRFEWYSDGCPMVVGILKAFKAPFTLTING